MFGSPRVPLFNKEFYLLKKLTNKVKTNTKVTTDEDGVDRHGIDAATKNKPDKVSVAHTVVTTGTMW